ncbi:MAG: hypothetical protein UV80_C0004G0018 [Candidatus Peregrinibacteria bacterium GW2011_GWF2_43_17]|nr:MAG: hypothetical protein UV80_C0004G0018 [Candidatus Peregrinibacteria bacterium GW2011_GWF2_43_17]KKT20331.1 MAG: hypothetical protein UW03_C0006G0066 [Candidatus Peregrinibacteria bacterium GW2011_GWA2_43_8]HAU39414.1 hypothetical protein [Candidatus Peregrinibacteria bacterium]
MNFVFDLNDDEELVFEAACESQDLFVATSDEFRQFIDKLNKKSKGIATYVFKRMKGDHWVFEENINLSDDVDCAILRVVEGKVYALSEDVVRFMKGVFKKV